MGKSHSFTSDFERVYEVRARMAGRKPKRLRGPVRATRPVYLRLPVQMVDDIRTASRERGWTINRWVETVVENALKKGR